MKGEEPLAGFARGLHQDALVGFSGLPALVRDLLGYLSQAEREAFRAWLAKALATLTPSEMKGALNRTRSAIGFDSKGAHALLRAAADELGLP